MSSNKTDNNISTPHTWTDADVDASYVMGAINSDIIKVDENDTFPSLSKVAKELERLKELGFDRPSDALRAIRYPKNQEEKETDTKDSLSIADVRNKLTPFSNLIAMIENGLLEGTIDVHPHIQKEIEQCKISIEYLSRKS